jgi:hypothetical protein
MLKVVAIVAKMQKIRIIINSLFKSREIKFTALRKKLTNDVKTKKINTLHKSNNLIKIY